MNQNERTVLISGASIAGPALAFWLGRHGFQVTLVERAPARREGGYKIDVRGAATHVLEAMGLLDEAHRLSSGMRGVTFVDRNNRPIASIDADLVMGREGNDVELMRSDLSRILHQATERDVEYVFGDSITSLVEEDTGVRVTFEHGAPRTFDLVIGADGLHSNVRRLVFGEESKFVRHLGTYISIFTVPNELKLDRSELFYGTPGHYANLYAAANSTDARALLAFTSPPLSMDRKNVDEQKRLLAREFEGHGWVLPRLIASMWEAPDFYFDSVSQVELEHWSSGRVALLGDAAYCPSPASGQGTSLALVGAYVLAGELAAANGDHQTAFARYEATLRPYVDQNLALGKTMAREMVPTSRAQLWFRTQMLRMLPYLPWKGMVTRAITEPLKQAANAIALPAY